MRRRSRRSSGGWAVRWDHAPRLACACASGEPKCPKCGVVSAPRLEVSSYLLDTQLLEWRHVRVARAHRRGVLRAQPLRHLGSQRAPQRPRRLRRDHRCPLPAAPLPAAPLGCDSPGALNGRTRNSVHRKSSLLFGNGTSSMFPPRALDCSVGAPSDRPRAQPHGRESPVFRDGAVANGSPGDDRRRSQMKNCSANPSWNADNLME